MATATAPTIDEDLKKCWNELHKDFYPLQFSTEEQIVFNNSQLLDNLRDLANDAVFSPLIARDMMQSHKDWAPSTQQNTWEIVFNDTWQENDRNGRFNKWCKRIHKNRCYDDIIHRFDMSLENWQNILCLDHENQQYETSWFRPPTFPSTLKMSLEMKLPSDWSKFYKDTLKEIIQRRYQIDFNMNKLYYTYHCNLIDAIYYAKCVNWDAAYDPRHSAKTNIPIYWIMAEIRFNFPTALHEQNGDKAIEYTDNIRIVPISCYGLMNVEVNSIKDWYKLSPHFEKCRDLRARLQINDQVEVFLVNQWLKGTIIDIIIVNNNELNNNNNNNNDNNNDNNKGQEPIVEYLQIQTVNDAIIRYNRYDDRIRPLLKTQQLQTSNFKEKYKSEILINTKNNDNNNNDENDALLPPPNDIDQHAAPQYNITNEPQTIPITATINNNNESPTDPRIQQKHNNYNTSTSPKISQINEQQIDDKDNKELEDYKVGPNDPTPDLEEEEEANNTEHINEDLMNSFDPHNIEIMQQYQTDLRETMETMQELALHRTVPRVVTDVFRPVHLTCPKHTYRVRLTDEEEINMTVINRNKQFDYIEVKMIDPEQPELSQFNVYMTPQQLLEHCTTYFHFNDTMPISQHLNTNISPQTQQQQEQETNNNGNHNLHNLHNLPPEIPIYGGSQIHEYMQRKDSSISPQRRRQLSVENNSPSINIESQQNPRSHLQDDTLQSFLHDADGDDMNDDNKGNINWMDQHFQTTNRESMDSKDNESEDINRVSMSAQKEFIDGLWKTKPDRMGLGADNGSIPNSNDNSNNNSFTEQHASGNTSLLSDDELQNIDNNDNNDNNNNGGSVTGSNHSSSNNSSSNNSSASLGIDINENDNLSPQHSNQPNKSLSGSFLSDSVMASYDDSPQKTKFYHTNIEEPATPKMLSPSPLKQDEMDSNKNDDNDDNDDNRPTISSIEDDEMLITSTINTKGIDLDESDDNKTNENNQSLRNNRSRSSVERVIVPPNKIKNDWKNEDEEEEEEEEFKFNDDNFNDIGINQYDETDDNINDINDNLHGDINDIAVKRIYTATPSFCSLYCIVIPIIIGIILLPILGEYLPEKYHYFDPEQPQLHWKYYWDYIIRQVLKFLKEYNLIQFP